ncbi:MAG: hypothetical protein WD200_04495 [Candidatus Andersenbacteria bacterium]
MTLRRKKEIGLVVIAGLYSMLLFMTYALLLRGPGEWGTGYVTLIAIAGIVWAALYSVVAAFIASRGAGMSVFLILPPPVMAFALGGITLSSAIAAGLLLVFLIAAYRSINTELKDRVRVRVTRTFGTGARTLVFGFLLTLIIIAVPALQRGVTGGTIQISSTYIGALTTPATPLIKQLLPGYTKESSVDELITAYMNQQQQNLPPGFTIPPDEHLRTKQELSRQLGIQVQGSETLPELLTGYFNQYLQQALVRTNSSEGQGAAVFAVGLLIAVLALRAVVSLIVWPTYALIFFLIYFSERIGLVTRLAAQVTVQQFHL